MTKRKTAARKNEARKAGKKAAPPQRAKRGSDIHTGQPTGREALHGLHSCQKRCQRQSVSTE